MNKRKCRKGTIRHHQTGDYKQIGKRDLFDIIKEKSRKIKKRTPIIQLIESII